MATQQEIESQPEVSVDLLLPDLAGLPGVTSVDGPEVFELEAVYVDTTDLRLAMAGMTLRRRTGGSDAGWHLKIPVSVDERTEIQAPLGHLDGQVPGELHASGWPSKLARALGDQLTAAEQEGAGKTADPRPLRTGVPDSGPP